MEQISYYSIISSRPFRFFVGAKKQEFTIHSALVAHQSPALDKLVNGKFAEARDGHVTWESVDEQTFIRFSQFSYTGDYDGAEPEILDVSDPPAARSSQDEKGSEPVPDDGDFWAPPIKKKKSKMKSALWETEALELALTTMGENLWLKFERLSYLDSSADSHSLAPKINQAHHDYTEVFLSHSRLHVFAECYGISALMKLSLHKLHRALLGFVLHQERLDDIVQLLEYCYADPVPEQLRELVVLYAACKAEMLWNSEKFRNLLATYGELSVTLIGSLLNKA